MKDRRVAQPTRWALIATFIGGGILLVAIWLSATLVVIWLYKGDLVRASQLGDASGVANSLFSAFAFGGIIATIYLQANELRLQRKELQLQRAESKRQRLELRRAADAQKESQAALNRQADSLLLAAYLNAIDSLWQSYSRGQSNADAQQVRDIRVLLQSIVDQLAPSIPYVAGRTASTETARQREADELRALAKRIESLAQAASIEWSARSADNQPRNLASAAECMTRLRDDLGKLLPEVPRIAAGPIMTVLRTIEELLVVTVIAGPPDDMAKSYAEHWAKGHIEVCSPLESVADLICEQARQIEAGLLAPTT